MKKWVFSSLLLVIFSCSKDERLFVHGDCPKSCYTGPKGTKDVGVCKSGKPVCNEDNFALKENGELICEGQVLPAYYEFCDGLDNNCDGEVDNLPAIFKDSYFDTYGLETYPCLVMGECKESSAICVNAQWACSYPDTVETTSTGEVVADETLCDSRDNDCDGYEDESILFPNPTCYSGNPVESAAYSPCHPGLLVCQSGAAVCVNEVTPTPETCNGIDDDCNGHIDDVPDAQILYDLVFLVDNSGSMCDNILYVSYALSAFSGQFNNRPEYKFALVNFSSDLTPSHIDVIQDFTDYGTIRNLIYGLNCLDSGLEASYDVLYEAHQDLLTGDTLQLSWRSLANKVIFMFTDEEAQSYRDPQMTKEQVVNTCQQTQMETYIWSVHEVPYREIAQLCNGEQFELKNNAPEMENDMSGIISKFCRE